MLISTKGRYALRVMVDISKNQSEGVVSLSDVSERQNVSLKYLEAIISLLVKGGLLESQRGKSGGYRLSKSPEEITVAEVLTTTEGSLAPVSCLEKCEMSGCDRAEQCVTRPIWKNLDKVIYDYLSSITLADVLSGKVSAEE